MKLQRFLECVSEKILNYPDIDLNTLKLFMDKFIKCLSKKELERNSLLIQMIMEHTSKQITIYSYVQKEITDDLMNQLAKQKEVDKTE